MIKKLIRYSRPIFIAFMGFILINILINYKYKDLVNNITLFAVCAGGALIASLIIGLINYYRFEVLLPKTRNRLLNENLFKRLLDDGFEENDGQVISTIKGYKVSVSFQVEPKMILVQVLFNPANNGIDYTKDELNQLTKPYDKATWFRNKSYWWGKGVLINQISCAFKMPDYEMVKGKIDQCIEILKTNGVKP